MAITETWLRDQKDAELRNQGYTMFRQDRNRDRRRRGRNSGGVAVYLRNDYAVDTEMVLNYSNRVTETLGLYSKSRNLLLIVMYRQPDDVVGGHRSTHILDAIDEIPTTAAAGQDRFPALLLKNCKYSLSKPLFFIRRWSLDTGIIPQLLKTANIIPIHKGKSQAALTKYRPVALTSHLIKLFKKVLRKHIVSYMEENELFNSGQHGFRLGRSFLSQLIAHYDRITQMLEEGQNVDVVYLDFAKAFDKVDFLVVMRKLQHLGISGKLGRWIHSFLTSRTQTVIPSWQVEHRQSMESSLTMQKSNQEFHQDQSLVHCCFWSW